MAGLAPASSKSCAVATSRHPRVKRGAGAVLSHSVGALLLIATSGATSGDCTVCAAAVSSIGSAEGLSHNAVVALAQDRAGFVWLATRDGLDRFDGTRIVRFDALAGKSLRAESVVGLAADPAGGLWVGLRNGVLYRAADVQAQAFDWSSVEPEVTGTALLADRTGVWVGRSQGLLRVEPRASPAAHAIAAVGSSPVRVMHAVGDQLWVLVGSTACQLLRLESATGQLSDLFDAPCAHALGVDNEQFWLDPHTRWQRGEALPPPAGSNAPRSILPWRGGWLFAGLTGVEWRSPAGTVHRLWHGRSAGEGRNLDGEVLAAIRDADDALWLGSYAGAHRLDPDLPAFNGVDNGALDRALQVHAVSGIAQFDSRWWFGSFGLGLLAWDPRSDKVQHWRGAQAGSDWSQLCGDFIWDLQPTESRLLVNARCAIDAAGRVTPAFEPSLGAARHSLFDRSGRLWAVAGDGLYALTASTATRKLVGQFEALAEAPAGILWLAPMIAATADPSAYLVSYDVNNGRTSRLPLPEGTRVYDLQGDGDRLWMATGNGLFEADPASGVVGNFVPPQPEAGRVFYSLQRDGLGAWWIGSNRGLLRFDPALPEAQRFRLYDVRDGVGVREFNRRSRAVTKDGELLFGGIGGVLRFDPRRAAHAHVSPRPAIETARIWSNTGERQQAVAGQAELSLGAADLTVALDFGAPGFRRAGHTAFRYQLQGIDADWVDATDARSARYPRLAPGRYQFRLQAGNAETGWQEADEPLTLQFLPAWHQNLWFRLPALLLLGFGAWTVHRWRLRKLLEVERLRTRIAADLHDELGSELAAIGMSTALLGARADLAPAERRRLAGLADSARRVAESMRDIVWYVNPDKDRLLALGERLQSLARRMLGEDRLRIVNGWRDADRRLPMTWRRELHLICREAFANILRHAGPGPVELRLEKHEGNLTIHVSDDGPGFDPAQRSDGSGLTSMRRRAAAIGARFELHSAPGQFTRIEISLTHRRRGAQWGARLG